MVHQFLLHVRLQLSLSCGGLVQHATDSDLFVSQQLDFSAIFSFGRHELLSLGFELLVNVGNLGL